MNDESSVGIVIPAYNPDIPVLKGYIERISSVLDPDTLLLEIDSPDKQTVLRLKTIDAELRINTSSDRRGKGLAITEGFDELETDILAFADADGSVPVESFKDVIEGVTQEGADVSIGSRRHPESDIVNHQTVVRRLLGDVFAVAARKMLPAQCKDYQCGCKAVRAEAWKEISRRCSRTGFSWDLEFISLAESLGYEISEVPVEWDDHPKSEVSTLSTTRELAKALIGVRLQTRGIREPSQVQTKNS